MGEHLGPRPASVDEYRWSVFTAYVRDGRSLTGIGASVGISSSRVGRILYEVDARLDGARRGEPANKPVVLESPIEDLELSPRALNVLHNLGCDRVQDVLSLSSVREMGPKTRSEVCAAFRRFGLPAPAANATRTRGEDRGLGRLRAKYSGEPLIHRPDAVGEQNWAIFTAYFRDGQSTREIGAWAGLSASHVSRLLYDVDARLAGTRQTQPARQPVVPESPVENLALSPRALGALHGLGCHRVEDVLGRDLSAGRGMGPKTWGEVRMALQKSGFPLPDGEEPWNSELRSLDRGLVRMRDRISTALAEVAKEIALLQKRVQKRLEMTDRRPAGAPAWPPLMAELSHDSQLRYE
jgi:hypothetical protein